MEFPVFDPPTKSVLCGKVSVFQQNLSAGVAIPVHFSFHLHCMHDIILFIEHDNWIICLQFQDSPQELGVGHIIMIYWVWVVLAGVQCLRWLINLNWGDLLRLNQDSDEIRIRFGFIIVLRIWVKMKNFWIFSKQRVFNLFYQCSCMFILSNQIVFSFISPKFH